MVFLTQAPPVGPVLREHPWVHVVEYRLDKDHESGLPVLIRREDLAGTGDILSGGQEWVLSDWVAAMEVICFGEDGEASQGWDSKAQDSLPLAVMIRLWVKDPRGRSLEPHLYTLRVALPESE
jgi:hypothetical protein